MVPDLNDLFFFAQVVDHGGFAAASRALGIPKSRLSRRVALLEERLGVRLLHRSSRRFNVTAVGQEYYRHCQSLVAQAEAAQEAIDRVRVEPQGLVRMSCPITIAQTALAKLLPRFLLEHPRVQVFLEATDRRVEIIEEGFDLALRVRTTPLEDSDLVIRSIQPARGLLVASPALLQRLGRPQSLDDLGRCDSLAMAGRGGEHAWLFSRDDGETRTVTHRPRLVTDEKFVLLQAAIDGVGIVALPSEICGKAMEQGALEVVLPEWQLPGALLHIAFPTRRGLVPAVRVLIDFLAEELAREGSMGS